MKGVGTALAHRRRDTITRPEPYQGRKIAVQGASLGNEEEKYFKPL
ncbi:MAG: hypothetical protein M3362_15995 [Acidobacteriota bacterium]|nr:hypothetical protein [Acidobacteriota bacterium]